VAVHEAVVPPAGVVPADLATVIAAWERLPEALKAGILAMVKAAKVGHD